MLLHVSYNAISAIVSYEIRQTHETISYMESTKHHELQNTKAMPFCTSTFISLLIGKNASM